MQPFAAFLLDAAIKSAVVLAIAAVATVALRRSSASTRHLIWLLAVMGVMALPMLSAALPGWQVLPGLVEAPTQRPVITSPAPGAATPVASLATDATRTVPSTPTPAPLGASLPLAEQADTTRAARPAGEIALTGAPTASHVGLLRYPAWIAPAWGIGAAIGLFPLGLSVLSLWWLRRTSRIVADPTWQAMLQQVVAEMRITRPVLLLTSPCRAIPSVWGVLPWTPAKIMVPEDADQWSYDRRRTVLRHELAHVQRADCLTQLLTRLACALYWFNPLIWYAAGRMRIECERACDDRVLAQGAESSDYAQQLLEIAAGPRPRLAAAFAGIAMARPSAVESRLLAILDQRQNRQRLTRGARIAAAVALAAVIVPVAMLQAQPDEAGGPWHTRLTHGGAVELLGIAHRPGSADPTWWQPDGAPTDATFECVDAFGDTPNRERMRQIVWRFSNLPAESAYRFDFGAGAEHRESTVRQEEDGADTELHVVQVIGPDRGAPLDFTVGIASGPWRGVGQWNPTDGVTADGVDIQMAVDHDAQTDAPALLTITHDAAHLDFRAIAIDLTGREHVGLVEGAFGERRTQQLRMGFSSLTLADVASLRFKVRPFEYVEYRNVATRLGGAADVKIMRTEQVHPQYANIKLALSAGAAPLPEAATFPGPQRKFDDVWLVIHDHRHNPVDDLNLGTWEGGRADLAAPIGRVTGGRHGEVAEVAWRYLRSTPDGDLYKFTRKYPIHRYGSGRKPKVTTQTALYAGASLTVFEDHVQRVTLRPRRDGMGAVPLPHDCVLIAPKGGEMVSTDRFVTSKGDPVVANTTAKVRWDDTAMIVRLDCEDDRIIVQPRERDDPRLWFDDSIELFFETSHDHAMDGEYYHVIVTAGGVILDEINGDQARDIEGLLARAWTTPTGWSVELTIPWQSVGGVPEPGAVWGMNFTRGQADRKGQWPSEYPCWSPTRGLFHRIQRWGHIAFTDNGVDPQRVQQQVIDEHEQGMIQVRCVDADSGQPLPGLTVRSRAIHMVDNIEDEAVTDEQGICRLDPMVNDPGNLMLVCEGDGIHAIVRLFAGKDPPVKEMPSDVKLELGRADALGGVIQDKNGQPVPMATVRLMLKQRNPPKTFTGRDEVTHWWGAAVDEEGRWTCNRWPDPMPSDHELIMVVDPQTTPDAKVTRTIQLDDEQAFAELRAGTMVTVVENAAPGELRGGAIILPEGFEMFE